MNRFTRRSSVGVKFENLSVTLQGRPILENITAEAPCGGATVIVGPNGAGKTTLLRCLLDETRHAGKIVYLDASGRPVAEPKIGYVPQQLHTDPNMPLRVYEFLAISQSKPLWLGCSAESRKKSLEFLDMVGAKKLEKQRLGDLSGGETRRVLLAAALGSQPDLLVLDEAEAGVDYRGERLFWELLDESRKRLGFTVLMVSHNLPLAAHYATHVIAIKTSLVAEGSPREALTGKILLNLFGIPIHLYPGQCDEAGPSCLQCGAYGNLPYAQEGTPPGYLHKKDMPRNDSRQESSK